MNKTYHLFVGLPRTGSTVLSSLINQNPEVYVASDTAMFEVIKASREEWFKTPTMVANPIPEQIENITEALLNSMWKHKKQSIIIDRNREWGDNIHFASELFNNNFKIICTIRDLPSIMASWKLIYSKEVPPESVDHLVMDLWKEFVEDCVIKVRNLIKDAKDKTLIIHHDSLMDSPREHLNRIQDFLELPKFDYDLDNIEGQFQNKNIVPWGPMGLHKIRNKFGRNNYSSYKVLGNDLYEKFINIQNEYNDVFGL